MKKEKQVSETNLLQSAFNRCIENNLPFASYRLPGQHSIQVVYQNSPKLEAVQSLQAITDMQGFVIFPFIADSKIPGYIISPDTNFSIAQQDISAVHQEKFLQGNFDNREVDILTKDQFQDYITHAKEKMRDGNFEKIVAARCIKKAIPKNFNPLAAFIKACLKYPQSFVSCISTAETGTWIGASPEILLNFVDGAFTTYSLAGTRPTDAKKNITHWGQKEQREQEIVSNFIEKEINSIAGIKLSIIGPETIEAGNIMHLRTTYNITNLPYTQWPTLVDRLHPTPAVCGMPKKEALEFIQEYEKDNRAYYSGFLGPININEQINLYVNLRCMEVQEENAILHVGCGITSDSDEEAEWNETNLKSMTMLSILE